MDEDFKNWIEEIRKRANSRADACQPWEHYFDLRAREMEVFFSLFDLKNQGMVLEIGCGNGFNSCVLSKKARKVIATDLFKEEVKTHSQGMTVAKRLVNTLGVRNCDTLSCSGEYLPFKEGVFDMVFSMYTLEHVPDRDKMLADVKRVLKQGGIFIFVVPNFIERLLYYPFPFYKDVLHSILQRLFSKKKNIYTKETVPLEAAAPIKKDSLFKRFKANYPKFPLPQPHGSYKSYFEEIFEYLPVRWKTLSLRSELEILDIFSSMLFPRDIFNLLFGDLSFPLYKRLCWIDIKLGRNPFLKNLGHNICFVLIKK